MQITQSLDGGASVARAVVAAWWVKACVALTVVELYVVECYRRAEGWLEEPLLPVWEHFTGFLRA